MLLGPYELPPLTMQACSNLLAAVFAMMQTLQGVLAMLVGSRDYAMLSACRLHFSICACHPCAGDCHLFLLFLMLPFPYLRRRLCVCTCVHLDTFFISLSRFYLSMYLISL